MTRETKIGLLVGLAFIIVIGILLSDHLTSATEPPSARLAQVGESVRQGISTPLTGASQPPVTAVESQPVAPPQPVPTHNELIPRTPPVQFVRIGPGALDEPLNIQAAPEPRSAQEQPAAQPIPDNPPQPAPQNPADLVVTRTPIPKGPGLIEQTARQYGEEIVAVRPRESSGSTSRTQPQPDPQSAEARTPTTSETMVGLAEYKAREGDNVSRMANRLLGGNTRANREAIIQANPSLQEDPNKVIAGRIYLVPVTPASASTLAEASRDSAASDDSGDSDPGYWYTTREGDSLWKIAAEQLGDPNAWTTIQELNKETLQDNADVIRPGMRLRLPERPVASVN